MDELGLILRQDQVWAKPNGLPESVVDRTRRSHEYLFHFVKSPRYFSAVDEIREPHVRPMTAEQMRRNTTAGSSFIHGGARDVARGDTAAASSDATWTGSNPLGKLPGSVWEIASQPLNVPDWVSHTRCCGGRKRTGCLDGLDHYAAFPMELPRRIIRGWSPREVCTACGEGRRLTGVGARIGVGRYETVTSYACACPDDTAPSLPGVVVDPFGGTATAALVAAMHGRVGVSVENSWDYCDVLARWRVNYPRERARAAGLDAAAVARVPVTGGSQSLFDQEES